MIDKLLDVHEFIDVSRVFSIDSLFLFLLMIVILWM